MLSSTRNITDPAMNAVLALPGACPRFARDEEIFAEGDSADYIFQVISGAVRTSRMLRDGRRQIDEFHFAGDYFGLEMCDVHRTTAEAMIDASVRLIRRGALNDLIVKRSDAAQALFRLRARLKVCTPEHALKNEP
jgi:CRP/FNR family nitrogen fixation transcriptional regulator